MLAQLLAPRLDDGTARVSSLVDAVTEAEDQFFALQHVQQLFGTVSAPQLVISRRPLSLTPFSAASGDENLAIKFMAASLAPPCKGPRKAPMAAVTQLCMSDSVDATTRAVKVEAVDVLIVQKWRS